MITRSATLVLCSLAACAARADYSFFDLGTLADVNATARGVNNAGQVVGYTSTVVNGQTTSTPFVWQNGAQTNLGNLTGGTKGASTGIGPDGTVVGFSLKTGVTGYHAATWKNGVSTDIGATLGAAGLKTNGSDSYANAVSSGGAIVGQYTPTGGSTTSAFISVGGTVTDLGNLGIPASIGRPVVSANAVNSSNTVVGFSYVATGSSHAFSWSNGVMTDLGTLGGTTSAAYGINEAGTIVGNAFLTVGGYHAFSSKNGVMTDLGTLGYYSEARAINNLGDSVGFSSLTNSLTTQRGVLFSGGAVTDLNSFLPAGTSAFIKDAWGINDNGWIVGDATVNGATHAYLLRPNPVPEPASLSVLAFGALALVGRRRRRA